MEFGKMISHKNVFFAGIVLLVIGLPFSKFLMSLSQIILVGNWLLEGNLKNKWESFIQNRLAVVLSGVFFIHVIGLTYSTDWIYGLGDVKKKLPLFLLPLIFSTSPKLTENQINILLKIFVAAVLVATIYSSFILFGFTGKEITDIRQISVFISHIRFSLMISFSTLLCAYFFKIGKLKEKIIVGICMLWFVLFLILMESLTGLITLSVGVFLLLLMMMWKQQNIKLKYAGFVLIFILLILPVMYLGWELKQFYDFKPLDISNLEHYTSRGERYYHEYESKEIENGNFVRIYIARDELKNAWEERSNIAFDSIDRKGHFIEYTIYRFLTSKGLRKDADGLNSISEDEVLAIENGIANVDYQDKSSLRSRIRQVIWEIDWYNKNYNPTGHSLTMRLEFWKIASGIIKDNLMLGVGTGDAPSAFENGYLKSNTLLGRDFWHRSHNQFIAVAVALGIFGLAFFVFSLVYPFWNSSNSLSYFYLTFFTIGILSMLSEDTLETQAGITFFAFFTNFLLFLPKESADRALGIPLRQAPR